MSLNRGIDVIEKVKEFAKTIKDLESFGFDYKRLVNEVLDKNSLEIDQKHLIDDINHILARRDRLRDETIDLETENSKNRQIQSVVSELKLMGLGLHELKQLTFTIVDIAETNHISVDIAVSRFLKDVEENYDDRLGFENKVNERKAKLYYLDEEIANKQFILQAHPFVGRALSWLQNGKGVEDIVDIHKIVQACKENTFSFDSDRVIDRESSKTRDNNNKSNRLYSLTDLTDELKKYGGIKMAKKEQLEKLDKLSKEIDAIEK